MTKIKTRPRFVPAAGRAERRSTIWTAVGAAVRGGWGATFRLLLVLIVLGSVIAALLLLSGAGDMSGLLEVVQKWVDWIQSRPQGT